TSSKSIPAPTNTRKWCATDWSPLQTKTLPEGSVFLCIELPRRHGRLMRELLMGELLMGERSACLPDARDAFIGRRVRGQIRRQLVAIAGCGLQFFETADQLRQRNAIFLHH